MLCCFYWFLFLIIYVRILFFSAFVIRNYLMKFAHLQRHALVFIFCCQRCLLPRPSPPTAVWYSIFCCFCFYFYFFFRFLFIHFFLCLCHFCGYHKLVRRATFPMWKIEMCFFFLEVGLEAVATPTGCREWRMGGGWRTQDGSCEQIYGSPKRDDA